jgi:hypothetical protein
MGESLPQRITQRAGGTSPIAVWPESAASRGDRGGGNWHRRIRVLAGDSSSPTAAGANPATPAAADAPKTAKGADPTPEIIAATEAQAAFGPHKQADLPPIPFPATHHRGRSKW